MEVLINLKGFDVLDDIVDHGLQIKTYGDTTHGCSTTGFTYSADDGHGIQMLGDLGTLQEDVDGDMYQMIRNKKAKLAGQTSIIGRSVVVYNGAFNPFSQNPLNAPILGCCVIGFSDGARWLKAKNLDVPNDQSSSPSRSGIHSSIPAVQMQHSSPQKEPVNQFPSHQQTASFHQSSAPSHIHHQPIHSQQPSTSTGQFRGYSAPQSSYHHQAPHHDFDSGFGGHDSFFGADTISHHQPLFSFSDSHSAPAHSRFNKGGGLGPHIPDFDKAQRTPIYKRQEGDIRSPLFGDDPKPLFEDSHNSFFPSFDHDTSFKQEKKDVLTAKDREEEPTVDDAEYAPPDSYPQNTGNDQQGQYSRDPSDHRRSAVEHDQEPARYAQDSGDSRAISGSTSQTASEDTPGYSDNDSASSRDGQSDDSSQGSSVNDYDGTSGTDDSQGGSQYSSSSSSTGINTNSDNPSGRSAEEDTTSSGTSSDHVYNNDDNADSGEGSQYSSATSSSGSISDDSDKQSVEQKDRGISLNHDDSTRNIQRVGETGTSDNEIESNIDDSEQANQPVRKKNDQSEDSDTQQNTDGVDSDGTEYVGSRSTASHQNDGESSALGDSSVTPESSHTDKGNEIEDPPVTDPQSESNGLKPTEHTSSSDDAKAAEDPTHSPPSPATPSMAVPPPPEEYHAAHAYPHPPPPLTYDQVGDHNGPYDVPTPPPPGHPGSASSDVNEPETPEQ